VASLARGQRIRLATQIGASLMGVLYILDEPSIGLHQRDNRKLLSTLKDLRDLGNTVLVVEHDEETIRTADHVIDMGPGAGEHGGAVVAAVLGSPALRAQWEQELAEMRVRIKAMRQKLVDGLQAAGVKQDMSFITSQIGMFSYSGLTKDQMVRLRSEFGVYGTDTGRMCVAAVNSKNIAHVCASIAQVLQ